MKFQEFFQNIHLVTCSFQERLLARLSRHDDISNEIEKPISNSDAFKMFLSCSSQKAERRYLENMLLVVYNSQ